ncbi:Ig-like domain-containing protein [Roseivirga echinicomitans]
MKLSTSIALAALVLLNANIALSQINTFPSSESFEQAFTTGNSVAFISNWTGNDVQNSARIFQGSNGRTGTKSLNIIPTSSFSGEVSIALDFTGINNPLLSFYAYSKQNGAANSNRPALVSFSTSIDGGNKFLDNVSIGDAATFPNDNTTSYTKYEYELPSEASGQSNVVVKLKVERGDGSGSVAEFVMDDLSIVEQILPLAISSTSAPTSTSVLINFNQEVTKASAETVANYSLDNGITVISASRTATNQVTLSTSVMPNANYQLTVNNVEDATSSTPAVNLASTFSYVEALSITAIRVLSKNSVEVAFNLNLDQATAETVSNYTINQGIGNPTLAQRSATEHNKVTLTLGSDLTDNNFILTVNGVKDASTLATATNLDSNFSYLPLAISSITTVFNTQIEVVFNQNVEAASANVASNYSLNFGYGTPVSAVRDAVDASKVLLTFSTELANNTYQLTIDHVANESGNTLASNLQVSVKNVTQTTYRTLVINEIFADPTGAAQPDPQTLPSGTSDEFIELYNAGTKAIDLANFDLTGGTIANFVLQPKAYVIVKSSSKIALFQPFGDVVGVSSWNTLSNGGEQLLLKDNLGNLVDSLTFNTDWYKDAAKADGGWSIEQINPALVCSDINNWQASNNAQGATPATENSVYDISPDVKAPNLIEVRISSPSELIMVFDEIMDDASLLAATYSLSNGGSIAGKTLNPSIHKSVVLSLATPMVSGTAYTLSLTGATDCAGNGIATNTKTFLFDNLPPVFNRLVFKDNTTIDVIFDEALNRTLAETEANFSINLGVGNPTNAVVDAHDNKRVRLKLGAALSVGTSYQFTFENLADTLVNGVNLTSVNFDFENQVDTVIVVSAQLLDVYFEADVDKVSAEQLVNYGVDGSIGKPVTAVLDNANPRLVHLLFGTNFPENKARVIDFEGIRASGNSYLQLLNTTFIYDTDDPDIDSVVVIDERKLAIYFDEILDKTSAESGINYSANNGIGSPSMVTLQPGKRAVILDFAQAFQQELKNRLSITGIQDLSGNAISTQRNYDFIYDRLAPRLVGISLASPTKILVEFTEEVVKDIAENEANYVVDNGIGAPISAIRSEKNTSIVALTFASLGNNAQNTLHISNISDLFKNGLPVEIMAKFSSLKPSFGTFSVLNDTTIQVQFTKALNKALAEDIVNYGFDNGVGLNSAVQDPADASLVTLNLTIPLKEGIEYRLVVQALEDTDGNISDVISYDFTYSTHIVDIRILTQNSIELTFDQELDEAAAVTIQNYALNSGIGNPISVVRSSNDFKVVTLLFNTNFVEGIEYELTVQNLKDLFGFTINSSRNKLSYDLTPPVILAVNSIYLNEIEVVFNEPLNAATARSINHYSLNNGIGNPVSASLVAGSTSKVLLQFSAPLTNDLAYQLTVDRVQDKQGKAMGASTFDFTFSAPVTPAFRDLVINELYFDTKPSSSLPNAEFIELYNRGNQNIELRDFMLTDKRDTAVFTGQVLAPGEYLAVTTQGAVKAYSNFGNAIGLRNFPSLSNTGESVYLLGRNKAVIDSIAYDHTFYNDATKASGGFSIELINPEKACFEYTNFAASVAPKGGTPASQNSVFNVAADVTAPSLIKLEVISTTELKLTFDEAMDIGTLLPANFNLQNGVSVFAVNPLDPFGRSIQLKLNKEFAKGYELSLVTDGVKDCAGNALLGNNFTFVKGDSPKFHELLITEIMATPAPSKGLPAVEYVEIYNKSDRIIDLEDVFFGDNDGSYKLTKWNLLPKAYLILSGNSAATALATYGDVLAVNSFPTLTIEDEAKLKDANGNIIFEVAYDRSFYQSDTKDKGGYSMELINPLATCFDNSNWTASNSANGGTPGVQNSVYDTTPDTTAPLVVSLTAESETQLKITFNEAMNTASMLNSAFNLSDGLSITAIEILGTFGKEVRLNLTAPFERGKVYSITLSGLSDCEGNVISSVMRNFSLGAAPSFQELIFTEIMANPAPSQGLPVVEYLEVFNASSKIIALAGLTLSDGVSSTTLGNFNLNPSEYLILVANSDKGELAPYGNVLGVNSWPSLNTSGDNVSLKMGNQIIHSVDYSSAWYRSTVKASGGYSLELIDLSYACVEQANWKATEASVGGTPGARNSVDGVNPDLIGPELVKAVALNTNQIHLEFNEKLASSSLLKSNISISGGISVSNITVGTDLKSATLDLSSALSPNVAYQLSVENLTDCSGNLVLANAKKATIVIAVEAEPLDIIINEILFNPRTGGVRFVEIYNQSNKYISLKGWRMEGKSNDRVISTEDIIVAPSSYKTITTDGDILKNHYASTSLSTILKLSSLPSLPSDVGVVRFVNSNAVVIDEVDYDEDWHSPLLKSVDGVSLERIRFSGLSNDENNWQSASSQAGYATPGYENSQAQSQPAGAATLNIVPKAFAPDVAGSADFTTINYEFNTTGNVITVSIYDSNGNLIKNVSQNSLVGTSGFFRWDGTTNSGEKARLGYYLILFEIIEPSGKVILKKETVAIGTRF